MPRSVEADVCIVGAGITAAMIAEKLAAEHDVEILVLEAGGWSTPFEQRSEARQRYVDYGENPWHDDHLRSQTATGEPKGFSPSMTVGGLAMHWGGVTPRFSPEDFQVRSRFGVGTDWPISYDQLDPFYQEAEERMGVAGEQGPPELDPRSESYPMDPLPLSYNLQKLRSWAADAGVPFWSQPSAKNSRTYDGRPQCCRHDTCWPVCPIGAKYSPDFTFRRLIENGGARVLTRTLVRRLIPEEGGSRIVAARAVDLDAPDETVRVEADTFVLAAGFVWSSHLLLLSRTRRHPDGLANSSGLVGKYLNGHRGINAYIELPMELYPGMNAQHSLVSKHFMRPGQQDRYLRHDLRIWESSVGRSPRLRDDEGALLLGDQLLEDWRSRATEASTVRMRAYYDVLPARDSQLTLDPDQENAWGDPLPRVQFRDSQASAEFRPYQERRIGALFERLAESGGGRVLSTRSGESQEHPGGGCRMGDDPATSVVDRYGRSHDHENLFVVGAPTMPTGGCANGTLTFCALGLHSAAEIGRGYPERRTDATEAEEESAETAGGASALPLAT